MNHARVYDPRKDNLRVSFDGAKTWAWSRNETYYREALRCFIESRRETTWAWGTHDCLQFVRGAVAAFTGKDYAEKFGTYRSRLGAYRILADYADLSEFITHLLGPAQPRAWARFGDVVAVHTAYGESAGICLESKCVFADQPRGVVSAPLAVIRQCWRV